MNVVIKLIFTALCMLSSSASAKSVGFPQTPAKNNFVVDQAELLSSADEKYINEVVRSIVKDERIPIFVVTINSLEEYGAKNMSVPRYGARLFDSWEIGSKDRNYGMLLFVSKKDRKLRIELGHDWAGAADKEVQRLIDTRIIPHFRQGDFSEGIIAGVQGMDSMGRGLSLESPYYEWWVIPSLATLAFFLLVSAFSLIRSGKKGVGWIFLMAAIAIIMFILSVIVDTIGGSDGFDGGFSGGGGADGGW